jgi:NAD(P)-dependent dehydrogenase (short-subunit alcohol dehydrogenase family)
MSTAIITGASRGLGLALARALARRGWTLAIDARGERELELAAAELSELTEVTAVAGDVSDPWHREVLLARAGTSIDLLVNNASLLKGPSVDPRAPQPELARYPISDLQRVLAVNVIAPLALIQSALPSMPDGAAVINVTSDAAVEPYPGWGGYGTSKAALDQLTPSSSHGCASTRSTPATCAPACTRKHSPARTFPIGRRLRTACPDSSR